MNNALHCLDTIEIHASDFDCDIESGNDSTATDKEIPTGHVTSLSTHYKTVSIDKIRFRLY